MSSMEKGCKPVMVGMGKILGSMVQFGKVHWSMVTVEAGTLKRLVYHGDEWAAQKMISEQPSMARLEIQKTRVPRQPALAQSCPHRNRNRLSRLQHLSGQ